MVVGQYKRTQRMSRRQQITLGNRSFAIRSTTNLSHNNSSAYTSPLQRCVVSRAQLKEGGGPTRSCDMYHLYSNNLCGLGNSHLIVTGDKREVLNRDELKWLDRLHYSGV